MPFIGFKCGKCAASALKGVEAVEHFSVAHRSEGYCLPPAVITIMEQGEGQERRQGDRVSPSMAGGCMREHALKRSVDYELEPLSIWKMVQGTIFHGGLEKVQVPGWRVEVPMPEEGAPDVEIWLGVPVSTRIDLLSEDGYVLEDYKTSSPFVKTTYDKERKKYNDVYSLFAPGEDNQLQLNVEAAVVEKVTGKRPALGIWKIWLGSRDTAYSWRYYNIPLMDSDALEARVADGANGWREFRRVMQIANGPERMDAIAAMPLAGRMMFGGQKCSTYCAMKNVCDAIIPDDERF
jgi:hypothetical protein